MKKPDFVTHAATQTSLAKPAVDAAVNAVFSTIGDTLDKGETVLLDEYGCGVVAIRPGLGAPPADDGEDVRAQVGDCDPGQDEESRIVDHEGGGSSRAVAESIR